VQSACRGSYGCTCRHLKWVRVSGSTAQPAQLCAPGTQVPASEGTRVHVAVPGRCPTDHSPPYAGGVLGHCQGGRGGEELGAVTAHVLGCGAWTQAKGQYTSTHAHVAASHLRATDLVPLEPSGPRGGEAAAPGVR
jgi:hypothetical protein